MKISERTSSQKEVPAALGYRMPAEWERHESTWLSWPQNSETWPGKRISRVEEIYLQMLEGLLPGEKVNLLVRDASMGAAVKKRLEKMSIRTANLVLHSIPTNDAWIRDYGPTYIKNAKGEKAWNKWIFNAWGGKYADLMKDTHIFEDKSLIPHPCFEAGLVLEGGSIEVNGAGTCLTTEQCLLNKNRNPQLSRAKIEQFLKDYLGVSHIIWLKEGIEGDDTDGHIDDIARFTDKNTVLTVFEEDEKDANYEVLKRNWEDLKRATDQDGKKWNVVKLPMPGIVAEEDERLPASYANFLIANESVLLPVYGHKNDKEAARILKEVFPKKEILPVRCNDLVFGLGAIHCVSQQEPQ
jgi:agmatine deiminase